MNMCSYNCCKSSTKPSDNIDDIAKLLKLLGEPNRLRILCVLDDHSEHCVCEFEDHMPDVSQSLLSHHLADLRDAGMVTSEKRGQRSYYRLTEDGKHAIKHALYVKKEDEK